MVHESLKLVVLTHIMTHSLTLVEHTKGDVYRRLRNPPQEQFSHLTCPRLLNRQIKFLLSKPHYHVLETCLSHVQEKLRASTRKPSWAALFASMLVLAMTIETFQQTLRCKEKTEKEEGTIRQSDTTADDKIALMEDRFEHLKKFFHQGYRTHMARGFNPLQSSENRKFLDEPSRSLAAKASDIVKAHRESLDKMVVSQEAWLTNKIRCFPCCSSSPPRAKYTQRPSDREARCAILAGVFPPREAAPTSACCPSQQLENLRQTIHHRNERARLRAPNLG